MKMNPSIALFAVSALLAGVAGAQEKAAEAPAADQPKQEKEITVSPEQMKKDLGYFLGFQSGQQLGSIPTLTFDDLDQASFLQGIKDGMVRKPAKDQEQLKPALDAFQKQIDERISAKAKSNLEASKKFMEENGKKAGVTTTKSGLQYKVVNKGGEEKFDEKKFKNPMFKVKYKGTLLDGTVFDDTKGKSVELPLQVIPGFAEALTTMPVGSMWIVYIPSELAYGENTPGAPIEPNSPLIFDLELDGISEAPAPQGGPMSISPEQLQEMLKQSGAQQQ